MPPRRPAPRGDAVGIDPQFAGVAADPPQGRFGVRHAVGDFGLVTTGNAVVGAQRHHAARRQVLRVRHELRRRSTPPTAAEIEHDRRPLVRRPPVGRLEGIEFEFDVADPLVDMRLDAIERRAFARLRLKRGWDVEECPDNRDRQPQR